MDKRQLNIKNVPPEVLEKAKQLAKESDRSLSLIVRDLLREWIAEQEKKAKPLRK